MSTQVCLRFSWLQVSPLFLDTTQHFGVLSHAYKKVELFILNVILNDAFLVTRSIKISERVWIRRENCITDVRKTKYSIFPRLQISPLFQDITQHFGSGLERDSGLRGETVSEIWGVPNSQFFDKILCCGQGRFSTQPRILNHYIPTS